MSSLQCLIYLRKFTIQIYYYFRGSAKAIPLIYENDLIYGRKAFVTGWGRCDRTVTNICLWLKKPKMDITHHE